MVARVPLQDSLASGLSLLEHQQFLEAPVMLLGKSGNACSKALDSLEGVAVICLL